MAVKVLIDVEQVKLAAKLAAKFVVFWDDDEIPPDALDVIVKLAIETKPDPELMDAAYREFDAVKLRTLCGQTERESGG